MYILFDKTTQTSQKIVGDYPLELVKKLLLEQHDIEVLSTYSNTLKYNYKLEYSCSIFDYEIEHDEIKF